MSRDWQSGGTAGAPLHPASVPHRKPHPMHRFLVLSALCTVTSSALAEPKPDARRYGWYADYAAGKEEAKRTGKPMMVVLRCEP